MSDSIKHECGIAHIRLRKPLNHYLEKYKTPYYGAGKLHLLMEKQRNRGQDGAGVASIKIDSRPGRRYISRYRSIAKDPITDIFDTIGKRYKKAFKKADNEEQKNDVHWLKEKISFFGEVYLGHLRYATHGRGDVEYCHPMLRTNNWRSKTLVMAGNFNLTNNLELFNILLDLGQHPKEDADTVTVLEKIGHFMDREVQNLFDSLKSNHTNREITELIEDQLDMAKVLKRACKNFDGGYAMIGLTGYGCSFIVRDPWGIRPAYYYADDEVVVVASEKPAIKTAFDVDYDNIKEIPRGHALVINKAGDYQMHKIQDQQVNQSCSFERIYFSRSSDPDIYQERKNLGLQLVPEILDTIGHDLENTVFSYVPNTAETSFLGILDGLHKFHAQRNKDFIRNPQIDEERIIDELSWHPRVEKLVIKDAKLRTFIANDTERNELVSHSYDTTYEVVRKGLDRIVIIDDSIVRGTTLLQSILMMLAKLEPKEIIIVSSAPQIRFPDCYGIDMSRMRDFAAFSACMALLKDTKQEQKIQDIYQLAKESLLSDKAKDENFVKRLYDDFSDQQISDKIAEILTPSDLTVPVKIIYQTVEKLHKAIPNHPGDWYFTGNYPTPGGNMVANRSFVNYIEGSNDRAY